MQIKRIMTGLALVMTGMALSAAAGTVYYVEPNGVDEAGRDGLSWETAFASIRYAVSRTPDDATVLVSNGVYHVTGSTSMGLRTIESLNGSAYTILDGGGEASGTFHAFSAGDGSTLRGFTMTNFYLSNGTVSVWGSDRLIHIYDCVFVNNNANAGGAICTGGGGGTAYVYDSVMHGNHARDKGGAVFAYADSPVYLVRTVISSNTTGNRMGGGIRVRSGGVVVLDDCDLVGNNANTHGGGIHSEGSVTMRGCRIIGNSGGWGGGVYMTGDSIIESSLFVDNEGRIRGGGADINANVIMRNCTVTGNSGSPAGVRGGNVVNCIIYPDSYSHQTSRTHSITDVDPLLDAEYKPLKGSPAVRAGLYQEWMDDATDLAGNPRILMGAVDIGAYEYVPAATLIMVK